MNFSKINLPQVQHIIAVASGKGGVGKSTVAWNLAVGMAEKGLKVGLVDADIYGPSLGVLTGHHDKPALKDGKFVPFEKHGVHTMSMGFLLNQDQPVMWRGPMIQTAIKQLFKDVDWPALDVLVVDMPPGTGDAHLTVAQSLTLTGVILVSTPQYMAWIDALKCLKTFKTLKAPILGVIENMSRLECSHCHHEMGFGKEDLSLLCKDQQIPYLGSLHFQTEIAQDNDQGTPSILKTDTLFYKEFKLILDKILKPAHF